MMNRLIVSIFFALLLCTSNCLAEEGGFPFIKWEGLGLTRTQQAILRVSDKKWSRISHNLLSRIANNKNKMKMLLCNPCSSDLEIRELQKEILYDQKMLTYQSMEIFLEKRSILTPEQREKLRNILNR